jgi:hypothetical protein
VSSSGSVASDVRELGQRAEKRRARLRRGQLQRRAPPMTPRTARSILEVRGAQHNRGLAFSSCSSCGTALEAASRC